MGLSNLYKKNFAKTRYYLEDLKQNVEVTRSYDAEKLTYLEGRLKKVLRKRALLTNFRLLLTFLIYAAIISSVVYVSPLVQAILSSAALLSGIIGVTVLLFMVAIIDFLKGKLQEELTLVSAHMIAIYNANDTEETP